MDDAELMDHCVKMLDLKSTDFAWRQLLVVLVSDSSRWEKRGIPSQRFGRYLGGLPKFRLSRTEP